MSAKKSDYNKLSLELHKKLKGKIEISSKCKLKSKLDWSTVYTPGVAAVSSHLYKYPAQAKNYTMKNNSVAVISDGSAIFGMGNLGAEAALPVVEGKAAILKEIADIDAVPLVLGTQEPEEIIRIIKALAPNFGGIILEDISAPKCFEIEERLRSSLSIPVMHDNQHASAIVVLAGLINATKVVGKSFNNLRVVVVGAGAAGRAITLLLLKAGIKNIIVADSKGALCKGRPRLSGYKRELAELTNNEEKSGDLMQISDGADVIIGVSAPGTIAQAHIDRMADKPIVFALANSIPEIMPKDAKRAGAEIILVSEEVNNLLVLPGIFRGALNKGVRFISDDMKLAVAKKIAGLVKKPTTDNLLPSVMEPSLVKVVASVVK